MEQNRIIKALKIIVYLVIAFLANQICQVFSPRLNPIPDFFLTLSWTFAYFYGGSASVPVIILAGVCRDWLYSPLFGSSILISLITSYIAGHFLHFFWQRKIIFLPLQIIPLTFVSIILEKVILLFNDFFQFDLPINLYNFHLFSETTLRSILVNMVAALFWLLIKWILPFIKPKKDIYAEDRAGIREEFS